MSRWTIAINAPHTIPATASAGTTHRQSHQPTGSGNSGIAMRRKPKAPVLPMKPAKVISIGVGAAAYASGNQVWNGKIGVLIAKARAKRKKSPNWIPELAGKGARLARADGCWPVDQDSPVASTR